VSDATRRLHSWKEIAAYVGRDVRTAQRWEAEGLPVHRLPHDKMASVFAYADEIDGWLTFRSSQLPGSAKTHPASDHNHERDYRSDTRALPAPTNKLSAALTAVAASAMWRRRPFVIGPTAALAVGLSLVAVAASIGFRPTGRSGHERDRPWRWHRTSWRR
jgi:hypothetical protein